MTEQNPIAWVLADALTGRDDGTNVLDSLDGIASALRLIARGGVDGPTGFEALAMAVGGHGTPGHDGGLSAAVRDGLHEVAVSIGDGMAQVAAAIRSAAPDPADPWTGDPWQGQQP